WHLLEPGARDDAEPPEEAHVLEVQHGAVVEREPRPREARRRLAGGAPQPLPRHAEVREEPERRAVLLQRHEELLADPPDRAEACPLDPAGERRRGGRAEDVAGARIDLDADEPPPGGPRAE